MATTSPAYIPSPKTATKQIPSSGRCALKAMNAGQQLIIPVTTIQSLHTNLTSFQTFDSTILTCHHRSPPSRLGVLTACEGYEVPSNLPVLQSLRREASVVCRQSQAVSRELTMNLLLRASLIAGNLAFILAQWSCALSGDEIRLTPMAKATPERLTRPAC